MQDIHLNETYFEVALVKQVTKLGDMLQRQTEMSLTLTDFEGS